MSAEEFVRQKHEAAPSTGENSPVDDRPANVAQENNERQFDETHVLPTVSGTEYDAPGHVNNLTPLQTKLLYMTWKRLLQEATEFGNTIGDGGVRLATDLDTSAGVSDERPLPDPVYKSTSTKVGKMSLPPLSARRGSRASGLYSSIYGSSAPDVRMILKRTQHKPKAITEHEPIPSTSSVTDLQEQLPEFVTNEDQEQQPSLKATFNEELWRGYLSTLPDADILLLMFLRARKWNLEDAQKMLLDTVHWRAKTGVYDIVCRGESSLDRVLQDSGKGFFNGVDKDGRLIFYVTAKLHTKSMASLAANEEYTLYLIELARKLNTFGQETACLIFDLTGSGYSNMDVANVKFLINCFQNHYPETLGKCFVVNAPWIFSTFWNMIKPMLDPVVAGKIVFVNKLADLAKYIPKDTLIMDLGGRNDFKYNFDVGLSERPLRVKRPERPPDILEKIRQLKSEFLLRKAELVTLTEDIANALEPLHSETEITDMLSSSEIDLKVQRRNYVKRELHRISKSMQVLSEPISYYHRLGVIDKLGNIDWSAAKRS